MLDSLTNVQLERLYRRIYAKMSAGMGYQPYGLDWPTMFAIHPQLAETLKRILAIISQHQINTIANTL